MECTNIMLHQTKEKRESRTCFKPLDTSGVSCLADAKARAGRGIFCRIPNNIIIISFSVNCFVFPAAHPCLWTTELSKDSHRFCSAETLLRVRWVTELRQMCGQRRFHFKNDNTRPHGWKETFVYAGEILEMELTCRHRTMWLLPPVQTDVPEHLLKLSAELLYKREHCCLIGGICYIWGALFLMPLKHANTKCACRYGHAHDWKKNVLHTQTRTDTSILPASITHSEQMSGNSLFSHDIRSSAA